MPKISLDNLERYDGHLKDWCDARFAESKVHENWHEAGPSGAVSFYPVPNRPIDPVVNFAFTETLPEGTKDPDNPSTITGVNSVKITKCGKNLCPNIGSADWMYDRGVNVAYTADGGCKLIGTAASNATPFLYFLTNGNLGKWPKVIQYGKTYTFSLVCNDSNVYLEVYDSNSTTSWGSSTIVAAGSHATKTITGGASFICRLCVARNTTVDTTVYVQIEEGTTATAFEPYSGTDYTVNLGDTYYGGSVDLSTGIMTVTHTSMTVDGNLSYTSSAFYEGTDYYRMGFYPAVQRPNTGEIPISNTACDILPVMPVGSTIDTDCFYFPSNSLVIRVYMLKTTLGLGNGEDYSTVANALTSFFTAHPAQLVYPVKTPTTVSLTPLQIYSLSQSDPYSPNTVYSDQQSVLVRYPKSPIVTGSELDNAILSLGGD